MAVFVSSRQWSKKNVIPRNSMANGANHADIDTLFLIRLKKYLSPLALGNMLRM